jgi:hypothetical protein
VVVQRCIASIASFWSTSFSNSSMQFVGPCSQPATSAAISLPRFFSIVAKLQLVSTPPHNWDFALRDTYRLLFDGQASDSDDAQQDAAHSPCRGGTVRGRASHTRGKIGAVQERTFDLGNAPIIRPPMAFTTSKARQWMGQKLLRKSGYKVCGVGPARLCTRCPVVQEGQQRPHHRRRANWESCHSTALLS